MHPNVLAERYASLEMSKRWSRENVIRQGRLFWIAVLVAQHEQEQDEEQRTKLNEAIQAYRIFVNRIDVESIARRERRLRHDVMAEIEEFNDLAGHRVIHRGMTSRDKTENVEQLLICQSLEQVRDRTVAILDRLANKAREFAVLDMCGRSHNTPAQVTTLGKRFANLVDDLLIGFMHLQELVDRYPFRGIKGPMGTQQDLVIDERKLLREFGVEFPMLFTSVGQVYPRTLDLQTVNVLVELAASMSNFAKMVRLMAGLDFCHEGFGEEQVGSSAMPHKINARTCERICGLFGVLKGHQAMIAHVAGDQWYEGDVSCSVIRRVIYPDAFFAIDGLYEAALTVLDEMEIFPQMIEAELQRYQPFLATTALLSAAIDRGLDRQIAHSIIRRHAVRAVTQMRKGGENRFVQYLARDTAFPLRDGEITAITTTSNHGRAEEQIEEIFMAVDKIARHWPGCAVYRPDPIR